MKTVWKLSMGRGAGGGEFPDLDAVNQWVDKGLVLVWGPTGPKGRQRLTQGEEFRLAHNGDLFYLCHGNEVPGILLLGEFIGHADPIPFERGRDRWYARKFKLIKKSHIEKKYDGPNRWWSPRNNSTFVDVPEEDIPEFEKVILQPYFEVTSEELLGASTHS